MAKGFTLSKIYVHAHGYQSVHPLYVLVGVMPATPYKDFKTLMLPVLLYEHKVVTWRGKLKPFGL